MRLKLLLGAFIGLFIASAAKADEITPNMGLTIPTIGSTGWGTKLNNNWSIIDSSFVALSGNNTFTGFNTYSGSSTWTVGNIILPATTASNGNIYMGTAKFFMPNSSIYAGEGAGNYSGNFQVCLGEAACASNTASSNIGIGFYAANGNIGTSNVALGENALGGTSTGSGANQSVGIGANTLSALNNPPLGQNVAVGYNASKSMTTGFETTAVGAYALESQTTANENTAFGVYSLNLVTSGLANTAIGGFAGERNTGNGNVMVGHSAGGGGDQYLYEPQHSPEVSTEGIFIGFRSGTTSSSTYGGTGLINSIAIGARANVGCNNCMVLGATYTATAGQSFEAMRVGIGTDTPKYGLHVAIQSGIYSEFGANFSTISIRSGAISSSITFNASGSSSSYIVTVGTSSKGPFTMAISTRNSVNFQDFTSSPSLSGCGTGPSIIGNNTIFTITGGSGANGCTAVFTPGTYTKTPVCQVGQQTMSLVNSLTYTVSASTLTISQTGLGTNKLDVHCFGRD